MPSSSTSSSTGGVGNLRSPRRRRRNQPKDLPVTPPESQGSILWTILLIGLVFCLADVAYILHYVDAQQQQQQQLEQQQSNGGVTAANSGSGGAHQHHPVVVAAAPEKAGGTNPFNPVDPGSGLSMAEYRSMDRQLFRHDQEINHKANDELKELEEQQKLNVVPIVPLTDEEWATIQVEKKHFLDMFKAAKLKVEDLDADTLRELPTWKEVTDLYGDEPRIFGLDQCEVFQKHSDPAEHFVSTAGTFNSGTNLMAELLIANCHMQDRMTKYGATNRGVRWQVPWGKHTPPGDDEFRLSHKTLKDANVDASNILPSVTIRDPYVWMNSMCRHEYAAHWHHDPDGHCPNLIPNEQDMVSDFAKFIKEGQPVKVNVKYNGFWRHHDSLIGMWNDWYREYWENASFSKIIVRYEDLIFHPQKVTAAVCHCAGGSLKKDGHFEYVLNSAKKGASAHGPMELRTGFIKAIIKYGKATHRSDKYTEKDLEYAKQHLDPEMMEFFQYKHPDELASSR
eukprot:CAMPEP_0119009524 /NCGR_PEP_ID=MMETSP1176-20130426/4422_1 /TAXON_ID=265551 /ORGANISM="Synedropsis recta cf, Strain CCMP1620" /LENGTH=508 /DNA_ID=CAMNT_0006962055 /DNA_START=204 /DNA_END=1730 /DNA_ORIENTATION=+